MRWLLSLALYFAFAATAFHAPAAAHGGSDHGHAEVSASLTHDETHGDAAVPGSPEDPEHYHCPAALPLEGSNLVAIGVPAKEKRALPRTAVLASSVEAPPTEPPAA